MATTRLGFRYPASTNSPNVPQDIQNLATDVDGQLYANQARNNLTLNAGWHQAVTYGTACWYRDLSGLIHLGGMVSNDNAFSGQSNNICTLPFGCRPSHIVFYAVPVNMGSAGATAHLQVDTNGNVYIIRAPALDANLLWDLSAVVYHALV